MYLGCVGLHIVTEVQGNIFLLFVTDYGQVAIR